MATWRWVALAMLSGCGLWLTEEDLCGPEVDRVRWYVDADGDGFGDPTSAPLCEETPGYAPNRLDCDDRELTVGSVDGLEPIEGFTYWCRDDDRDGVGRDDDCLFTCDPPLEYQAPTSGDCSDDNPLFTTVCPWTDVSAEREASCGLRTDGTIACWGNDESGVVSRAPTDGPFVDVETGRDLACARRDNGQLECWGLLAPTPARDFVAVDLAVGWGNLCALDAAGAVGCWEDFRSPFPELVAQAPAGAGYAAISMDEGAACVLDANGAPTCWGAPPWRDMVDRTPATSGFQRVSIGQFFYQGYACGLAGDGGVTCWGSPILNPPGGAGFTDVAVGAQQGWAIRSGEPVGWGPEAGAPPAHLDDAVSISVGDAYACALRENGQVTCWGGDNARQLDVPAPGLTALAAGGSTTCGITSVGSDLRCWGTVSPDAVVPFDVIDSAGNNRCGLRDGGRLDCWSRAGAPLATPFLDTGYRDVFVGTAIVCVELESGALRCATWDGDPISTPTGVSWQQVEVNGGVGCGLNDAGEVRCWGGLLHPPVQTEAIAVTVGDHACLLDSEGELACWGGFVDGNNERTEPWDLPAGPFVSVSAGFQMDCALRSDGTVACWHSDGLASVPDRSDFVQVRSGGYREACGRTEGGRIECWAQGAGPLVEEAPAGGGFVGLTVDASGIPNACAWTSSGEATCWGDFDIVHDGDDDLHEPSVGRDHVCSLWRDALHCFGADAYGQVTGPLASFVSVAAGDRHSCGIRTGGTVACWGSHEHGQATPRPNLSDVVAISAGAAHTCARRSDGTVSCWGDIAPPPAGRFESVASGGYHACVVADGAVQCWGRDDEEQTSVPGDLPPVVAIAAGGWHTCALGDDGYARCWGLDSYGQATAPRVRFQAITAGSEHTCGLRLDGLPWCWGRDLEGQSSPPAPEVLLGD